LYEDNIAAKQQHLSLIRQAKITGVHIFGIFLHFGKLFRFFGKQRAAHMNCYQQKKK